MKAKIIYFTKSAFIVLGIYAALRYVAFPSSQAGVLALAFGLIAIYLRDRQTQEDSFSPFFIQIFPNWYHILADQKAINDEKWQQIERQIEREDPHALIPKYKLYHYGVRFTLLKPDVVYNSNHNSFSSSVQTYESIFPREMLGLKLFQGALRFYVVSGIDGYELGIETPESFKKSVLPDAEDAKIHLATIPYSEFWPFYRARTLSDRDRKARDENRDKYGWKEGEEQDAELMLMRNWPSEIKHEYFDVYYDPI